MESVGLCQEQYNVYNMYIYIYTFVHIIYMCIPLHNFLSALPFMLSMASRVPSSDS